MFNVFSFFGRDSAFYLAANRSGADALTCLQLAEIASAESKFAEQKIVFDPFAEDPLPATHPAPQLTKKSTIPLPIIPITTTSSSSSSSYSSTHLPATIESDVDSDSSWSHDLRELTPAEKARAAEDKLAMKFERALEMERYLTSGQTTPTSATSSRDFSALEEYAPAPKIEKVAPSPAPAPKVAKGPENLPMRWDTFGPAPSKGPVRPWRNAKVIRPTPATTPATATATVPATTPTLSKSNNLPMVFDTFSTSITTLPAPLLRPWIPARPIHPNVLAWIRRTGNRKVGVPVPSAGKVFAFAQPEYEAEEEEEEVGERWLPFGCLKARMESEWEEEERILGWPVQEEESESEGGWVFKETVTWWSSEEEVSSEEDEEVVVYRPRGVAK